MRAGNKRVLVVLPPGGGKTVVAAFMGRRVAAQNSSLFFNCHRAELLQQTSLTFSRCELPHGFIASGKAISAYSLVNVCSIDTLKNRVANLKQPKFVIWDECHHIGAAGWAAIMKSWPDAFHIGLTGTPWRLDGTGLGEYFDVMIEGPTVAELMAMGALSPYEIYAPPVDMKGVRKQFADFAKGESAERLDKPKLIGDIIEHWRKRANGLRTVGYAINRAHSHHLAEQFRAAGIAAAHLDGDTPKGERKQIIRDYAAGTLRVLFNVDLFGEGFDLSAIAQTDVTIDCVIQARPTMSLSLDRQQKMRCMRPGPGKIGIILDHAGNCQRHGFPDDDIEWTLEGRAGNRKGDSSGPPPPVTCPGCFRQIRLPLPPKCKCGHVFDKPSVKPIEVGDGELVKVTSDDMARMRKDRKREENDAKTLQDLVALAVKRGYKNPQKWAFARWSNSRWRQAS